MRWNDAVARGGFVNESALRRRHGEPPNATADRLDALAAAALGARGAPAARVRVEELRPRALCELAGLGAARCAAVPSQLPSRFARAALGHREGAQIAAATGVVQRASARCRSTPDGGRRRLKGVPPPPPPAPQPPPVSWAELARLADASWGAWALHATDALVVELYALARSYGYSYDSASDALVAALRSRAGPAPRPDKCARAPKPKRAQCYADQGR